MINKETVCTQYPKYRLVRSDRGIQVRNPEGSLWVDVAVSLKIAIKWIEADIAERRENHRRALKALGLPAHS